MSLPHNMSVRRSCRVRNSDAASDDLLAGAVGDVVKREE